MGKIVNNRKWRGALVAAALSVATSYAGQHCIYDAVPLEGAWEMAYLPEAWTEEACPVVHGVRIENAVPGLWENMVPSFRKAGMKDEFKPNPHYMKQTHPITCFANDLTVPGISGCFIYRRTVRLDRAPGGAFLAFECVRNKVRVWVNGKFAAAREGFSTPFELAVPDGLLRRGDNEIVLSVSNDPCTGYNGQPVSGMMTRGPQASTGGIEGRVELRFAKNGIADVYVTTAKDLKTFTVHVGAARPEAAPYRAARSVIAPYQCGYEISDSDGKVLANGEAKGDFTLSTKGFEFWSPENPVRYTLTLTTPEGKYSQKFGIRRLVADGERLRLNGRFVYLRGVTEHCYYAKTVHMPRDIEYYREIMRKRRDLGFNFVRFHTYLPTEEFFEATDELGLLVHVESPNFVPLDEYRAIVAFARRHPSVVIYCTGNETMIDSRAEKYLKAVADIVHGETDALFTPMSAMRGVEYVLGRDGVVNKPFKHNPARMKRLAAFCDFFTSYQLGATSYYSLNGQSAVEVDRWGDAYCGKPRVSHEICIDGSFADISIEKDYPEGSPLTASGVYSEIRRNLAERGLLDRAETYARNSSEWMWRIRKFTFEKVRSMKRTIGYDFLGDINTHYHTFGYFVGMMDEFFRLKPGETVKNALRYNSAAVLFTDLGSDFNVMAGEKKRVALSISNYAGDAKDGVVKVELVACRRGDDFNAERQRGREGFECVWKEEKKVGDVKNGDVVALGEFEVPFPTAEKPVKYLLRASFAGGAVKAENEWEMYAFPTGGTGFVPSEAATKRGPHFRVVSNISRDDLVAAMARGERVLLFGAGPFKSLKTSYRIGLAGRPSGNYATVVKKGHPALAGLPHEGYCGWQFRRLMEDGAAVQLEAGVPFDPIIEIASSEKFLIRQAALFEYRVGEGRLLVCSFRFGDGDPAAAWLKARLEAYASSDAFNPEQVLTPAQLRAVIDAPLLSAEGNRNKAVNPNDPASKLSVHNAIGKTRVVQGKYPYTEVNDRAMNGIIVADRAIDAAWVEAANDPAAFKARQERVRAAWLESIGGLPERCDLDVKTTGVIERDGYRVEKTLFQSRPGHHVTATVFVPTDPRFKAPYPAVLVACGHSYNGKMWTDYQRPGVIGAKNGFVVMVYDPIDQGERPQNRKSRKPMVCQGHNRTGHRAALVGWNTAQFRIWDGIRALDALCSRHDVDAKRLAVTGHSGGGTDSSYIMAMDKRIAAAAPSGFVASIRGTNWDLGASDAEQQFYGQLKYGMNHLALFMLAADRCAALHLATHADFFPFIGVYETAEYAAKAFKSLGRGDCFQLIDTSGPHLWAESSKQAEFLWFRKHLRGEDVWKGYDCTAFQKYNLGFSLDDPKVDVGLARDQKNLVTPTGNVLDLPGERTVYDLIREEARRLESARKPITPDAVREVTGIRKTGFHAEVYDRLDQELANGKSSTVTLLTDDGIALQMFTFRPTVPKDGLRPVMIVSEELNSVAHAARVEEILREGRAAVIIEARGWGLTGRFFRCHRGEGGASATKYYGCPTMDEMVTMKYYHLGENMVAHRAEDMLSAADAAKKILGYDGAFDIEAYGRACIPAAHARFVGDGRFAEMKMVKPSWSWKQMIDDENLYTRFADVVHGAYRHYDWMDLVDP